MEIETGLPPKEERRHFTLEHRKKIARGIHRAWRAKNGSVLGRPKKNKTITGTGVLKQIVHHAESLNKLIEKLND